MKTNVGVAPLTYTLDAHQTVHGIDTAAGGMTVGEVKHVIVTPVDGHGLSDQTALHELPKQKVPEDIRVGMKLRGKDPSGRPVQPIVKEIKDHTGLLNFNHPLAGKLSTSMSK